MIYVHHLSLDQPYADHMHIIIFQTFLRSSGLFMLLHLTIAPLLDDTIYVYTIIF